MDTRNNSALVIAILIVLSSMLVNHATAVSDPLNLPSAPITIQVTNGTESYFNTEFSEVPSGYDVTNTTYPGWCVDITASMTRSPANHEVILYSSSNPPGNLASEKWNMVNYILNHKQGTADDIQQAIWYFINMDGSYTPTSSVAWEIVNSALANGNNFVPANGQKIAIICFPLVLIPGSPGVQTSIIEIENKLSPPAPDVAIANVALGKSIAGQGFPVEMLTTVANFGNNAEDFNVATYANTTLITRQEVTLAVGNSSTIGFGWNTASFPYGNYTIKAVADTVPGETNTADNTFLAGSIIVTIPGDLNGDLRVRLSDLVILANAYGTQAGSNTPGIGLQQWNPNADIDSNGVVGLSDLTVMVLHYGQHFP